MSLGTPKNSAIQKLFIIINISLKHSNPSLPQHQTDASWYMYGQMNQNLFDLMSVQQQKLTLVRAKNFFFVCFLTQLSSMNCQFSEVLCQQNAMSLPRQCWERGGSSDHSQAHYEFTYYIGHEER